MNEITNKEEEAEMCYLEGAELISRNLVNRLIQEAHNVTTSPYEEQPAW